MIVEAKAQADGKPLGFYSGGRENAVASVTVKGVGRCLDCQLSSRCLHDALSELGVDEFRALVFSHRRLQSGDCVFRSGETFQAIYLVRAGFVKTVVLLEDGREQVTGLYMPGDMLGMDGIASGTHASDAIALADADVCVIPYERLEAMSHQEPSMRRHLHRLLSGEIIREQRMMLLLGSMSAEERVAAFLVNLSQRFAPQVWCPVDLDQQQGKRPAGDLRRVAQDLELPGAKIRVDLDHAAPRAPHRAREAHELGLVRRETGRKSSVPGFVLDRA